MMIASVVLIFAGFGLMWKLSDEDQNWLPIEVWLVLCLIGTGLFLGALFLAL